jgi:hypothetical protein
MGKLYNKLVFSFFLLSVTFTGFDKYTELTAESTHYKSVTLYITDP